MEFIVEKIGMSRTVGETSTAVTLLRVLPSKVVRILDGNRAIISYSNGKKSNKAIAGMQKAYELSKEFNRFATVTIGSNEVGEFDASVLADAKVVKTTLKTKGRGFSGLIKRWNFSGGPATHGSRFHRTSGSIGNREWPGKVQRGKKMSGQYGNETVTVKNSVISFENGILVLKGSIPGFNGAFGRVRIAK
jgi:large subunit ribosomal protein L3